MAREIVTLAYIRLIDALETDKAWAFEFVPDDVVFMPKSQVEDIRESYNEVDVPLWLVEAKGLEGYIE